MIVSAEKGFCSACSSSWSEAGSEEGSGLGDAGDFLLVNLFFLCYILQLDSAHSARVLVLRYKR